MGDFSATPAGQPLCCTSTDACAAGWKSVNDAVAKVDAMPDIRARNKAISASYAKLYMASPDLKWAGTAAFASKQVGCGMDTAHTYLDDYPGGIGQAAQDMAASGGGIDPVSATMYDARQTLGAGNLAVYDELYPSLKFYQENKATMSSQQIMSCIKNKPGTPVDPSITKGLQQTMDGHGTDGAITMLMHEQQDHAAEDGLRFVVDVPAQPRCEPLHGVPARAAGDVGGLLLVRPVEDRRFQELPRAALRLPEPLAIREGLRQPVRVAGRCALQRPVHPALIACHRRCRSRAVGPSSWPWPPACAHATRARPAPTHPERRPR